MTSPPSSSALQYFVTIAELGTFTAAARALHISQPSLSAAVRKLEDELGSPLFERGARGVRPTPAGEVLLQHARQALRALELARDEIAGLETEARGRFVLGCHASLAAYFLPGFMADFLRAHPGIEITLWNGNSRDVERAVIEGQVQLGVVVNPEGHPDSVVTPLFADRVELVVGSGLRRSAGTRPGAVLGTVPLVYVPELRQSQYLIGAVEQRGVRPRQHLRCSSLELVKSLTLDGVGVGILPMRVAVHGVERGSLRPLSASLPRYDDQIALVRRGDMHRTAAARLLIDGLRAHGRRMPPLPPRASKRGRRRAG